MTEDGSSMDASRPALLGAVLAGGRSRRFGTDKTAARVGGVPMLERAATALESVSRRVVVISARPDTPVTRWPVVADLRPGEGPLAGVETALVEAAAAGLDAVVVLAADLPLVGAETLEDLVSALGPDDRAVAAAREPDSDSDSDVAGRHDPPRSELDFEPLCAVYRVTCREVAGRLLDEGRRDARALFMAVDGRRVDVGAGASVNVNTPASLTEAEAMLSEDSTGDGAAHPGGGAARGCGASRG